MMNDLPDKVLSDKVLPDIQAVALLDLPDLKCLGEVNCRRDPPVQIAPT
jgi:hypothetical protein